VKAATSPGRVPVSIKDSCLMLGDEFRLIFENAKPNDRYAFFMTVVDRATCMLAADGYPKEEILVAVERGWKAAEETKGVIAAEKKAKRLAVSPKPRKRS
jgi:hypothetical protein